MTDRITIHDHICYAIWKSKAPLTRIQIMSAVHINRGLPLNTFKERSNNCYFYPNTAKPSKSTLCKGWITKGTRLNRFVTYNLTPDGIVRAEWVASQLGT